MKHKHAKALSFLLTACLIAGLLPWAAMPARAEDSVEYIDAQGTTVTLASNQFKALTSTTGSETAIEWNSGFYVVRGNVTISSTTEMTDTTGTRGLIRFSEQVVNLILCDGATLTVQDNREGSSCAMEGKELNIFAQTKEGTGQLIVKGDTAIKCMILHVYGGAATFEGAGGNGCYLNDGTGSSVTIDGGNVTFTNNSSNATIRGPLTLKKGTLTVKTRQATKRLWKPPNQSASRAERQTSPVASTGARST